MGRKSLNSRFDDFTEDAYWTILKLVSEHWEFIVYPEYTMSLLAPAPS